MRRYLMLLAALGALVLGTASHAQQNTVDVVDKVLLNNLKSPWAVVAAPDGNIWIAEKGGDIKIYDSSYALQATLNGLPELRPSGQGGLLDIAFHPQFESNGWVYMAYVVSTHGQLRTRINRFTLKNGALQEHLVLLDGPGGTDSAHFGSRLVFDGQGYLYATFGDRHQRDKAQDLGELHGKIVRMTDSGLIPQDNPFAGSPIFTLGHRNPQGLDIHPVSGVLYNSEHGPTGYDGPGGGDEINALASGGNFGWPLIHHDLTANGMFSPLKQYTPAIAPSGIAFYTGDLIPQWKNDLFVTALRGQRLVRLRINDDGALIQQEDLLLQKYGRLRDIGNAPDGSLLIVTDNGQLVRLAPAK